MLKGRDSERLSCHNGQEDSNFSVTSYKLLEYELNIQFFFLEKRKP